MEEGWKEAGRQAGREGGLRSGNGDCSIEIGGGRCRNRSCRRLLRRRVITLSLLQRARAEKRKLGLWILRKINKGRGRETNGQTNRDRQTGRQTNGQTDGRTDRQADRRTDEQTVRRRDQRTERQTDGKAGRHTDRQTYGPKWQRCCGIVFASFKINSLDDDLYFHIWRSTWLITCTGKHNFLRTIAAPQTRIKRRKFTLIPPGCNASHVKNQFERLVTETSASNVNANNGRASRGPLVAAIPRLDRPLERAARSWRYKCR